MYEWATLQVNLSSIFPTRAVQVQKMVRDLKFQILEVERLYYLCSENKGADQIRYIMKPTILHTLC